MRKAKFSRQVTFSMSEATYEGVKRISDKAEISIAELIRKTNDELLTERMEEAK